MSGPIFQRFFALSGLNELVRLNSDLTSTFQWFRQSLAHILVAQRIPSWRNFPGEKSAGDKDALKSNGTSSLAKPPML